MRRVLAFLALLVLASFASAQICGDITCTRFGTPFHCVSNPCAQNVGVGTPCKAPWNLATAVNVCGAGAIVCCNCIGPLACTPMLIDNNTLQVFIQSDQGLMSIEPHLQNASATIYNFEEGTSESVIVIAAKIDTSSSARVEFRVCDTQQCLTCDPVVTIVVREAGKPVRQAFSQLPETEDQLTVYNGSPGLRTVQVTVNGRNFSIAGLQDGEERTLDISAAMLPGEQNTIAVAGMGKPGGSAAMMIHDIAQSMMP